MHDVQELATKFETKAPKVEGRKIQVLWLSDTPTCATGFGQVAKNLLRVLYATGKYEFTVVGINHSDYYDREKYPYKIYEAIQALNMGDPKYRDVFGRQRLLDFLGTGKFDLLFTLQDTFIIEAIAPAIIETQKANAILAKQHPDKVRPFKWISYFPIDSTPRLNWVFEGAMLADFPVCYTKYGIDEMTKVAVREHNPRSGEIARVEKIYHGTNTKDFFPIDDKEELAKFRKDYFQGKAEGKFLIINVNRNQPRKDLSRTLAAYSKFLEIHPDSFLYLHCQVNDVGGNLVEISRNFPNLNLGENWSVPSPKIFQANSGIPLEILNKVYNVADALISTTWGEGWGLSFTEAMATKTLVIAPNNTSVPEILGENEERGLIADAYTSSSEFIIMGQEDNERLRPLTNVDSLVAKLDWAYRNRGSAEMVAKIEAAYAWVLNHTWDGESIGQRWVDIFERAYQALLEEKWIVKQGIGRNDLCPFCLKDGNKVKFKKCQKHFTR